MDADYDVVFPRDVVHRLDLVFCPTDFKTMTDDLEEILMGQGGPGQGPPPTGEGGSEAPPPISVARDPVYVPATLAFEGRSWPRVGVRFKGNSSLTHSATSGSRKLPLRLDLDEFEDSYPEIEDQRFFGFKKLALSPGFFDPSYVRELLSSEILEARDIPVARSVFATLWVDMGRGPTYWGLYTLTEHVDDDPFLERIFGHDDGNLYEPELGCADWTCFSEEDFVKQSHEEEADWSDVRRAVEALHADREDAWAWRVELEAAFDVWGFLHWLALNTLLGNGDAYGNAPHNYYLHGDPEEGGRVSWLPWDYNMAFLAEPFPLLSVSLDEVDEAWPLIRLLLDDPLYHRVYVDALADLQGGLLEPDAFAARARELHARIAPWVEAEAPPLTQLQSVDAFHDAVDGSEGLVPFLAQRLAERDAFLAENR